MKNKNLIVALLLIFSQTSLSAKELFKIGDKDGSAAEFGLASANDYMSYLASYGGQKCNYAVGYSTSTQGWSYVLPGPLDSWAGGGYWAGYAPRHFPSIWFELSKATYNGTCTLTLDFVGVSSQGTTIRVEINGNRFEYPITGNANDSLLNGTATTSSAASINIEFPSKYIHSGMNRIVIGSIEGSWSIFDAITLDCPESIKLSPIKTSTLIKSAEAASFELDNEGVRIQPVLVDIEQSDKDTPLTFYIKGQKPITITVEKGQSIVEVGMKALPEGSKPQKTEIKISQQGGEQIYSGYVTRHTAPLQTKSDYVDLLIGTGNSRWMFKPGPSLPMAMVQIAPDNQNEIWKAGYEYTVENITGFNHISDWTMTGFLMQPTVGVLKTNSGREKYPDEGYRSRIDKNSEKAQIGCYKVRMTDTDIYAEITSTRRAAMQRYTFPESDSSRVLIDMFTPNEYPHNLVKTEVKRVGNNKIEGYATYYNAFTGYSLEQNYTLWFVLEFDRPFDSMGGWVNQNVEPVTGYIGTWSRDHEFDTKPNIMNDIQSIEGSGDAGVFVNFKTSQGESIVVRSGISIVDIEGARNNLKTEITTPFGWNFDAVVDNAKCIWNEYLSRIDIKTSDHLQKVKFYTNLYRAIAAKATWSDVDGRYVDENEQIQKFDDPNDYIVSGEYWNTFWNNQQLFNLVAPELSSRWARSAIELYKKGGWFNTDPAGVEHTGVMVAMHVVSQIQGAWQSGIRDFSLDTAYVGLRKMLTTPPEKHKGGATVGVEHLVPYMKYGYIPSGMGYSSNTLEYAYDDWCLAQMAKSLGKTDDYELFIKRSENWRNLFDTESGFIRPKDANGEWIEPFDPYHTPGFVEGNAFNYTWFVPHNPEGLVEAMGSKRFIERLDQAMEKSAKANFNAAGDNFSAFPINHGNETSMEVTALFNWAGAPWLSQKWARAIQEQYYGVTPYDAYPGDEDLGQMSAWFVMSSLGLFQLDGGCGSDPCYELTSPRYERMTIRFDSKYGRGKSLVINAKNASKTNMYILSARLNGRMIDGFKIPASELLKGGILDIEMGDKHFLNK